jgi:hypothetical protein
MTETMIREDFVRIVLVGLLDRSGNGQIADLYLVAASLRAVVMTHSQCVVYKGQRLRRGRLTTAQASITC